MGVKLVFASTPAGAFAALRKKPGIHLPFYYKQNGVRKQPLSYRLPCAYFLCDTTSFFRDMRSNRQGHQYSERVSGKSIEGVLYYTSVRTVLAMYTITKNLIIYSAVFKTHRILSVKFYVSLV